MKDIFSSKIRSVLPFDHYIDLVQQEERRSWISMYLSTREHRDYTSGIKERIDTLQVQEEKEGFVYVGEKQWLQHYLETKQYPRYDQWVSHVFENELRVSFAYVEYTDVLGVPILDIPGFPTKIWRAEIDPDLILTKHEGFRAAQYEDTLQLNVYGPHSGPSPVHLVKMFECLCMLEYLVHRYTKRVPDDTIGDIWVEGIHVEHPSACMYWSLDFFSSYANWDIQFNHRM